VKPLVLHCEANVEFIAATKYYQCIRAELARDFLRAVRRAQDAVQKQPERFSYFGKPVRRVRVPGFPYRMVYEELDDCIHVVGFMHDSRNSGYWKNRLS